MQVRADADLAPVVRMLAPCVVANGSDGAAAVGVQLVGQALQGVSARLELATKSEETGNMTAGGWTMLLDPPEVRWSANETGVRWVGLRTLSTSTTLRPGLQVQLSSVVHASISREEYSTDVIPSSHLRRVGALAQDATPVDLEVFTYAGPQVAYPGQNVVIPVMGSRGPSRTAPTTVLWRAWPRGDGIRTFAVQAMLQGVLVFEPGDRERNITIPIRWDLVPPEAEFQLGAWLGWVRGRGLGRSGLGNVWRVRCR